MQAIHRLVLLRQLPWFFIGHILVGAVGQRHDFAQRAAIVAGFVVAGNVMGRGLELADELDVGHAFGQLAVEFPVDEPGAARRRC